MTEKTVKYITSALTALAMCVLFIFILSGTEYKLTFLSYTAIVLLATASWLKIMHIATQSGMIFGKWQNALNKFDEKGLTVLYKWLGGCEICTCSFFSFLSIGIYLSLMYKLDAWIITGWIWNILWVIMYWSIGTVLNLYFMVKLFDSK